MVDDSIESSLTRTVADTAALDLAAELADAGLDEFLSEGPLKDVPVIGHALKVWRAGRQIRDLLFAKKLARLLSGLQHIPASEREEFAARMEDDPSERRRVTEHLLLVTDQLDDMEKADIVARAFACYVRGKLPFEQLRIVLSAISRCVLSDLFSIRFSKKEIAYEPSIGSRLSGLGILQIGTVPAIRGGDAANQYLLTDLGHLLFTVGILEVTNGDDR